MQGHHNYVIILYITKIKIKTKILVLSAVVVASLSLLAFLSLYQIENFSIQASVPEANRFKDTIPEWASDSIIRLNDAGIIKGYNDGRFGAADKLTRAQATTVLYRTLRYRNIIEEPDPAKCPSFKDIKDTDYFYLPVCFLALSSGVAEKEEGGNFEPHTQVPRDEMAGLLDTILGETLIKATNASRPTNLTFKDVPEDDRYADSIAFVDMVGLMKGKSAGVFDPDGILNRGEMAVVMDRTLNLLETLKIKELANSLRKQAYLTKCADLIDRQATACAKHENWLVDIQVSKQNTKTKESEIEINETIYGPGNRCDSSQVTDTIPGDVQTAFLDNQEAGDSEDIQVLCNVICIGWDSCPGDKEPTPEPEEITPKPEPTQAPASDHSFTVSLDITATEHTECGDDCIGYTSDATANTTITFDDLTIGAQYAGTSGTINAPFSYSCSSTASGGKSGSINSTYNNYSISLSTVSGTSDPSQGIKILSINKPGYVYFDSTCEGTAQDPSILIGKAIEKAFGEGGALYKRVFNANGETVPFSGRDHDAAISNEPSYFEYSGSLTITPIN